MISGAIFRAGTNDCLVANVNRTAVAHERMRGLLGRPPLRIGEGLLIVPCLSVHTFFMSYPLDLVFLDTEGSVCKCVKALRPWRISGAAEARSTLELPAGGIAAAGIRTGEVLEWRAH